MAEPVEVRPLTPEDTPAVLDLLRVSFGEAGVRWSEAIWTWKHLRNPFGPSPGLLAWADGRPVALRVFLRWSFRGGSGEEPVSALRAVDTVTHPEWRGRGLFSQLTRELVRQVTEEGARFVFNTPNSQSRPGYLRLGWRVAGRVPLLVRVQRPWRLLRALVGGRESPLPDLSVFPPVDELLSAPEAEGWTGETQDPRLTTLRSMAYLRWRYRDIEAVPGFRYASLKASGEGAQAALVFRARHRRGLSEVDVAEVWVRPADREASCEPALDLAAGLLRRLARETNADILAAVASPGTPERLALRRAGFLPFRPQAPRLTVLPLQRKPGSEDPLERNPGAWRWSLGDLELF